MRQAGDIEGFDLETAADNDFIAKHPDIGDGNPLNEHIDDLLNQGLMPGHKNMNINGLLLFSAANDLIEAHIG